MNLNKILMPAAVAVLGLSLTALPAEAQRRARSGGARGGGQTRQSGRAASPRQYNARPIYPRQYGGSGGRIAIAPRGGFGYGGYYGSRGYYSRPYYFGRPFYSFRPRFSIGFGLWVGYPVPWPYDYYGYPYATPYPDGDSPYGYPPAPTYNYPYGSGYNYQPGSGYDYPPDQGYSQPNQSYGQPNQPDGQPAPGYNGGYASGSVNAPGSASGSVSVQGENAGGGVSFDITPKDAAVYVDGTYIGRVSDFGPSYQPLAMTPGSHRIEIQAPGYRPMTFDANITPGQVIPYRGSLQPY